MAALELTTPESPSKEHYYSTLSPDMVMDAIESLGFHCDARILELNSYENRVFQIGVEDASPVIGKFYRNNRWDDATIIEEHEFTQELCDEELSVVPPMIVNGATLHQFGKFRFSLYERRGGRAPALDNLDSLEVLGRAIGRIHSVSGRKPFQHRPELDVASYGHASRTFLLENNWITPDLLPAYESVSAELLTNIDRIFGEIEYTSIRLHGDCHPGNVLVREDIPHFVDFDDARSGPAIQDLWMLLSGDREYQQQQLLRILDGYFDFCEFNPAELRLSECLRALRLMYHAAWIARRWDDPAFPRAFPFFDSGRYWSDHILELREQWAKLDEPPLTIFR